MLTTDGEPQARGAPVTAAHPKVKVPLTAARAHRPVYRVAATRHPAHDRIEPLLVKTPAALLAGSFSYGVCDTTIAHSR